MNPQGSTLSGGHSITELVLGGRELLTHISSTAFKPVDGDLFVIRRYGARYRCMRQVISLFSARIKGLRLVSSGSFLRVSILISKMTF